MVFVLVFAVSVVVVAAAVVVSIGQDLGPVLVGIEDATGRRVGGRPVGGRSRRPRQPSVRG